MRLSSHQSVPGRHSTPGKVVNIVVYGLMIFMLFLLMLQAIAGDLTELQVTEEDGIYNMKMVMLVHVQAKYVHKVLTDYTHIYRLNPSITESHVLPSPGPGLTRVKTVMTGCVAFFCRDVGRVEDIRELGPGKLRAVIVPELSSLLSGTAEWDIQPMGNQTRVVYQATMEPDFFIPPLIGPIFVKENIRGELIASFNRIECVSQIRRQIEQPDYLQLASYKVTEACDENTEDEDWDHM